MPRTKEAKSARGRREKRVWKARKDCGRISLLLMGTQERGMGWALGRRGKGGWAHREDGPFLCKRVDGIVGFLARVGRHDAVGLLAR